MMMISFWRENFRSFYVCQRQIIYVKLLFLLLFLFPFFKMIFHVFLFSYVDTMMFTISRWNQSQIHEDFEKWSDRLLHWNYKTSDILKLIKNKNSSHPSCSMFEKRFSNEFPLILRIILHHSFYLLAIKFVTKKQDLFHFHNPSHVEKENERISHVCSHHSYETCEKTFSHGDTRSQKASEIVLEKSFSPSFLCK